MNILAHKTVWLTEFDEPERTKALSKITLPDDPIALGCASYRLAQAGRGHYHDLNSLVVEPEDRQQAQNIRNYYRAKITWELLKKTPQHVPLSAFRQKLMSIIEGSHELTENDLGIVYRVPYFYVEDTQHDAIFDRLPDYEIVKTLGQNIQSTLTLVQKIEVLRRAYENTEYWFKLPNSVVPCMIVIENKNKLRTLFESMFARGPVQLRANWHPQKMWGTQERDRWYYKLARVELA